MDMSREVMSAIDAAYEEMEGVTTIFSSRNLTNWKLLRKSFRQKRIKKQRKAHKQRRRLKKLSSSYRSVI